MKKTLVAAFLVMAASFAATLGTHVATAGIDEDMIAEDDRYKPEILTVESSITSDRIYVVEEGDTLWDICEMFFNDAWYWPTLWAYNPQITNPHWIFPGDYVYVRPRFDRPRGRRVQWARSRFAIGPKDVQILARRKSFISERRYRESGVIAASREEKTLFGDLDEIYIKFSTVKKIRPDQEYTIYRVEGEVDHPVSGETLGYRIRFLGMINVLNTDQPMVGAVITRSFEEIERGDLVTAAIEPISRLVPRKNDFEKDGVIAAYFDPVDMVGEHYYVWVDLGSEDGVKRGNRFVVLARGDGMVDDEDEDEDELEEFPWETIGEGMVVEPQETTSLAIMTRSVRELEMGMKIRFIKGY